MNLRSWNGCHLDNMEELSCSLIVGRSVETRNIANQNLNRSCSAFFFRRLDSSVRGLGSYKGPLAIILPSLRLPLLVSKYGNSKQ